MALLIDRGLHLCTQLAHLGRARAHMQRTPAFAQMFLDTGGAGSRVPRSVPADATNLTVSGTVPCKDSVMAWAAQGPYRVFEDGTVEFLAAPVPPCQGGDYYVWIGFPK
ncbi:MAG: hypothetical protein EBU31_17715 [Proteobacteria bacterium]|nr:hypothetical protein [Pseudomonadota bacterium]